MQIEIVEISTEHIRYIPKSTILYGRPLEKSHIISFESSPPVITADIPKAEISTQILMIKDSDVSLLDFGTNRTETTFLLHANGSNIIMNPIYTTAKDDSNIS
jgi:hypothetical protein